MELGMPNFLVWECLANNQLFFFICHLYFHPIMSEYSISLKHGPAMQTMKMSKNVKKQLTSVIIGFDKKNTAPRRYH
jgi:hypothetical protein